MRHRLKAKTFNRDTKARKGLVKGLVRSLLEHGSIETTKPKAKEIKRLTDKLLSRAQEDTLARRRMLHMFFGTRDVVNTIFDRIMPLFPEKVSGFTRITVIGNRRGDNAEMVTLALTAIPTRIGTFKPEVTRVREEKPKAAAKAPKATKSAKKVTTK